MADNSKKGLNLWQLAVGDDYSDSDSSSGNFGWEGPSLSSDFDACTLHTTLRITVLHCTDSSVDEEDEEDIVADEADGESRGTATAGDSSSDGLRSRSAASLEATEIEAVETVRLAIAQQTSLIPMLMREQQVLAERMKEAATAHEQAVS